MMFGTEDEFEYLECHHCGCLQIASIPENISNYYPSDYYSYMFEPPSHLERWLRKHRARYALTSSGLIGRMLTKKFGKTAFSNWMKTADVRLSDRILDVGCGSGELLYNMMLAGCTNLTGIDPYLSEDAPLYGHGGGIIITNSYLQQISESYDFIMMHHSFEHMENPLEILEHAASILSPTGTLLIRIPVADSEAWRRYGPNWIQLDAPRHFFLHTQESMKILAGKSGLKIVHVEWDSTAFQFWGSEQYKRGIPHISERSYRDNRSGSIFSASDVETYSKRAEALNARGQGDQACFYLRFQENHQ